MQIRIGRTEPITRAEGPGIRFAIWVQGCSLRCAGCFNPHLWDSDKGTSLEAEALLQAISGAAEREPLLEGITFLGGEPFDQAFACAEVAVAAQAMGLSVMVFSGFTLKHLRDRAEAGCAGYAKFLDATDLLVDGPFLRSKLDKARPWVGSTNQEFRFLTSRYGRTDISSGSDQLEVFIEADGTLRMNGWVPKEVLAQLTDNL